MGRPHNLPRGDRPIHGGHGGGGRVSTAQQHTTTSTPSRASPAVHPSSSPPAPRREHPKLYLRQKLSQNPTPTADRLVPSSAPPQSAIFLPSTLPLLLREGRHPGGRPATHRKSHAPPNSFFPPHGLTPSLSRSARAETSRADTVGRSLEAEP